MKRRPPKYKSSKPLKNIFQSVKNALSAAWKIVPFAVVFGFFYFTFFGVRQLLLADSFFQVAVMKVFPKGILTDTQYQELERYGRGMNLLEVDLKRLKRYIETNPDVRYAHILRRLPNELEIYLTKRIPKFQLRVSPQGQFYTVDSEGVVMRVSKTADPALPVFIHYTHSVRHLDLLDGYQHPMWQKMQQILDILRTDDMVKNEKIPTIALEAPALLTFSMTNGPDLKIASPEDLSSQKMAALGRLLTGAERQQLAYIDLSRQDIVVKYKT